MKYPRLVLFNICWVQSIVLFFLYPAWALYDVELVVLPLNAELSLSPAEAASDASLEICVKLAAYYGLRRSEVLGLKWDAINLEQERRKDQKRKSLLRTLTANRLMAEAVRFELTCRLPDKLISSATMK